MRKLNLNVRSTSYQRTQGKLCSVHRAEFFIVSEPGEFIFTIEHDGERYTGTLLGNGLSEEDRRRVCMFLMEMLYDGLGDLSDDPAECLKAFVDVYVQGRDFLYVGGM